MFLGVKIFTCVCVCSDLCALFDWINAECFVLVSIFRELVSFIFC